MVQKSIRAVTRNSLICYQSNLKIKINYCLKTLVDNSNQYENFTHCHEKQTAYRMRILHLLDFSLILKYTKMTKSVTAVHLVVTAWKFKKISCTQYCTCICYQLHWSGTYTVLIKTTTLLSGLKHHQSLTRISSTSGMWSLFARSGWRGMHVTLMLSMTWKPDFCSP